MPAQRKITKSTVNSIPDAQVAIRDLQNYLDQQGILGFTLSAGTGLVSTPAGGFNGLANVTFSVNGAAISVPAANVTSGTFGSATSDAGTYAFSHLVNINTAGATGIAATVNGPASGVAYEFLTLKEGYLADSSAHAFTWRDGSNITGQIDTRFDGTNVKMVFGHLYHSGYATTDILTLSGDLSATFAGTITSGLINGQTISSAANFTGSVAVGTTLGVTGKATVGNGLQVSGANPLGSGLLAVSVGSLTAMPVSDTASFIVSTNTGFPSINNAGDLALVPRSDIAGSILLYTGSGTPALRFSINGSGVANFQSNAVSMGALTATTGTFSGNVSLIRSQPALHLQDTSGTSDDWQIAAIAINQRLAFTNNTSGFGEVLALFRDASAGFLGKLNVAGDFSVNTSKFTVAASSGNTAVAGVTTFGAPAGLKSYTVGTLPTGVQGYVAYCTDLLTPGFLTIAVGGGGVVGPVFYNGSNWVAF